MFKVFANYIAAVNGLRAEGRSAEKPTKNEEGKWGFMQEAAKTDTSSSSASQGVIDMSNVKFVGTQTEALKMLISEIGEGHSDLLVADLHGRWGYNADEVRKIKKQKGLAKNAQDGHDSNTANLLAGQPTNLEGTELVNQNQAHHQEHKNAATSESVETPAQKAARLAQEKKNQAAADKDAAAKAAAEAKAKKAEDGKKSAEIKAAEAAAAKAAKDAEKAEAKAKRDAEKAEAKANKDAEREAARIEAEAKRAEKVAGKQSKAEARYAAALEKARKDVEEAQARLVALEAAGGPTMKGGRRKPGADSKAGKVWGIIESLGGVSNMPTRSAVIDEAVNQGLDADFAKSKYGSFRRYHGMFGRVEA